jgi:hypothetical protein
VHHVNLIEDTNGDISLYRVSHCHTGIEETRKFISWRERLKQEGGEGGNWEEEGGRSRGRRRKEGGEEGGGGKKEEGGGRRRESSE